MTTVREGVEAELALLAVGPEAPGLVAMALNLASQQDRATNGTAAANVAAQLRQIMTDLRELAPVDQQVDPVTNLNKERKERRGA